MSPEVVAMTPEDARWAAELMDARRRTYATYSPVFWRPAADPVPGHAKFLAGQIAAGEVVALRTDSGFFGRDRTEGPPQECLAGTVETKAAEWAPFWWCPAAPDTGRSAELRSAGFEVASGWYVGGHITNRRVRIPGRP